MNRIQRRFALNLPKTLDNRLGLNQSVHIARRAAHQFEVAMTG